MTSPINQPRPDKEQYIPPENYYDFIDDDFDDEIVDDDFHDEGISRVHSDTELEAVIKELLMNSQRIDAKDITVKVDNCNVTLSGSVKSQEERDYAVSIVKLVHGVGEVNSDLIVKINEGILPTDIGRNPG